MSVSGDISLSKSRSCSTTKNTQQKFISRSYEVCYRFRQLCRAVVLLLLAHQSRRFQSSGSSTSICVSMMTVPGRGLHGTLIVPARKGHILLPPTTQTSHMTAPYFTLAGEWECNRPIFPEAEEIWILEHS